MPRTSPEVVGHALARRGQPLSGAKNRPQTVHESAISVQAYRYQHFVGVDHNRAHAFVLARPHPLSLEINKTKKRLKETLKKCSSPTGSKVITATHVECDDGFFLCELVGCALPKAKPTSQSILVLILLVQSFEVVV